MVRDVVNQSSSCAHAQYFDVDMVEGTGTGPYWYSMGYKLKDNYRADVVQGNFHTPLPYEAQTYEVDPQQFKIRTPWKWQSYRWRSTRLEGKQAYSNATPAYNDTKLTPPYFPEHLKDEVTNALLDAMHNSDVDVGVFLGELPETIELISLTAIKVARAFRQARKGNWKNVAAILDVDSIPGIVGRVNNGWLAYSFGWKPLLNDIFGSITAVNNGLDRALDKFQTRTIVREEVSTSFVPLAGYVAENDGFTKGIQGGVAYGVDNTKLQALKYLGLLNPLNIAWELVPYSFVIDWLVPIGNWLRGWTAPIGVSFSHGYLTRYVKGTLEVSRRPYYESSWNEEGGWPRVHVNINRMGRQALADFPHPKLAIPPVLSLNQVFTLLTLLNQRV